jgi:hypothetical protein
VGSSLAGTVRAMAGAATHGSNLANFFLRPVGKVARIGVVCSRRRRLVGSTVRSMTGTTTHGSNLLNLLLGPIRKVTRVCVVRALTARCRSLTGPVRTMTGPSAHGGNLANLLLGTVGKVGGVVVGVGGHCAVVGVDSDERGAGGEDWPEWLCRESDAADDYRWSAAVHEVWLLLGEAVVMMERKEKGRLVLIEEFGDGLFG